MSRGFEIGCIYMRNRGQLRKLSHKERKQECGIFGFQINGIIIVIKLAGYAVVLFYYVFLLAHAMLKILLCIIILRGNYFPIPSFCGTFSSDHCTNGSRTFNGSILLEHLCLKCQPVIAF